MNAHLSKPVNIKNLVETLDGIFKNDKYQWEWVYDSFFLLENKKAYDQETESYAFIIWWFLTGSNRRPTD